MWLVCVAAAIGWFFVMSYLETDPPFEPAPSLSRQQ
jgi:hypothetical protein